jgi:iron complex outermembrane receptor protein
MICLTIFQANAQKCDLVLSGVVMDASNNAPLEKAVVEIKELGIKFITDIEGHYHFYNLCKGSYTIVVNHMSCDSIKYKLTIQKNIIQNFKLPHAINELENVSVNAKRDLNVNSIKEVLSSKVVDATRGQSLGEVLSRANGVTVLQTGSTIFKPVIHGLHSQRVLLINNGVRLESQQWGSDHAPEIDPFIAEKFTVIKGAGALKYGNDAIAGAVLIEPKVLPKQAQTNAEFNTGYFSNNRQYVVNGMIESSPVKFPELSYRVQATYKKGGNARTPNYWLHNTGLQEINYSGAVGLRKEKYNTELFVSSFNTDLGIFIGSHVGNLSDLQNAINASKPSQNIDAFSYAIGRPKQNVQHYTVKSKSQFYLPNNNKVNLLVSYQKNLRKEFDRAMLSNRPELDLDISTTMADVNFESGPTKKISSNIGLVAMLQENVWAGSRFFVPNFRTQNIAVYSIHNYNVNNWMFDAGARFDYRHLRTYRNRSDSITAANRTWGNASGTLGATYKITPNFKWLINGAYAWRAPQVNELYVNGLHHGTSSFEIGNQNLKSEKAFNISTQLKYQTDSSWQFDLSVYNNIITDFINLIPSVPATLTLRGAYPTFRYVQSNAVLRGIDFSVHKTLNHSFMAGAKTALLWAKNSDTKEWIIQMPSNRIEGDITYSFANKLLQNAAIELRYMHIMQQTRIPVSILDYIPPPNAYSLLNVDFSSDVSIGKRQISVGLTVVNLLNQTYRDYMNRFRYFNDEPGRSINLRIKLKL